MKAIKIPNATLLDAFGRLVAINSYQLECSSSNELTDKLLVENSSKIHDQTSSNVHHSTFVQGHSQRLTVIGETLLHIAIVYNDINSVKLSIKHGIDVNQRIVGDFNIPKQNQNIEENKNRQRKRICSFFHFRFKSQKSFNPQNDSPESCAYYGEYPLAFAAAFGHIEIYDYLIEYGADPNMQDTYGNTVLHMLVIRDRLDMFKHAVRHSSKKARTDIRNHSDLTPLTLSAKLGRREIFLECLELAHMEIWRYSNIKCCTYPLRDIDTITDDGEIDWNSSLMSIVSGKTENHLNMLDDMVVERLLNDKWSTFAQTSFVRQLILLCLHLLSLTVAVLLRNPKDNQLLAKQILCYIAEICVLIGCIISIFTLIAKEIYILGFNYYLHNSKSYPEKFLYQCSCILILLAVPFRILHLTTNNIIYGYVEDGLISLAIPGTFLFFLFFGRIYALTGTFIVMIFEMITGDIATFGVIYIIVITAFGQVFYLLFRDTTEGRYCQRSIGNSTCGNDDVCSFKNFEAWMTMIHFTMGEFNFSRFDLTHYSYLVKSLFFTFMILTPILLLNMLIASMGNTYQRVIAISEKERIRQWAQLVLTIERSCSAKQRFDYQSVYAIGTNDKRDLMVIKRATKSKAAQRKGATSNWKRFVKSILYLLKEQQVTSDHVRLHRLSHQSILLKPKLRLDNMVETLAWERDIDLSGRKALTLSKQYHNLDSTLTSAYLYSSKSQSSLPPPPQFLTGTEYPIPSSVPQRLTEDRKIIRRSELSELRTRPSFIDYEDLDIFNRKKQLTRAFDIGHRQSIERISMMPVNAEGYKDLLLDFDSQDRKQKKSNRSMLNTTSNKNTESKLSKTTMC